MNERKYEVEVRAHIPDVNFNNLLTHLTDLFDQPKVADIKTFLFRNQNGYSRIRILKGNNQGTLTEKIGNYTDKAREEINKDFDFIEVDNIIKEFQNKGLVKCSYLRSTGYAFSGKKEQKLYLSKHEHLGNFLEIEVLVNEQSEINEAHDSVERTLIDLNLKELSAIEYQNMMDQMYAKTLRPVSEYKYEISPF